MKRPAAAVDNDPAEDIHQEESVDRGTKSDLDERIEGFKKFCAQEEDVSARGEYLKQYFTTAEMKSLWNRLKTMRSKATGDAKTAWDEISERKPREGKNEEKENYLAAAITEPERWQQIVISRSISLRRTDTKGTKSVGLYMGELITKHGYQEAMDFIRKGKYKACTDAQGDTFYKKVQVYEDSSITLEQSMGAQGQSQ